MVIPFLRAGQGPLVGLAAAITLLGVLGGTARASDGSECATVNVEISARLTPWRRLVDGEDAGDRSQADRCATLKSMLAELRDVRAAYDDRHQSPGLDLSCDRSRTVLDSDAAWIDEHQRVLGCGAPSR
jgi:hypothetical protein